MLIAILLAAQGSMSMAPIVAPNPANTAAAEKVAPVELCEAESPAGIIVQGGKAANSGIIVQGGKTADSGIIVQGGKTADSGIIVQGGRTAAEGIIVQGGLQPSASEGAAKAENCPKKRQD